MSVDGRDLGCVDTGIDYVKKPVHGGCHASADKDSLPYLGRFCYRFNPRMELRWMPERLGYAAERAQAVPERVVVTAEAQE